MAAAGGTGMAPVGETAPPVRAGIGQDIPSTGTAQVGGRTKRRVNTGFASGAASSAFGLLHAPFLRLSLLPVAHQATLIFNAGHSSQRLG